MTLSVNTGDPSTIACKMMVYGVKLVKPVSVYARVGAGSPVTGDVWSVEGPSKASVHVTVIGSVSTTHVSCTV